MDPSIDLCSKVDAYLSSPSAASVSLNGHAPTAPLATISMKREDILKEICGELKEKGGSSAWLEVAFHRALNIFLVFQIISLLFF